jgi:hypothetical protein
VVCALRALQAWQGDERDPPVKSWLRCARRTADPRVKVRRLQQRERTAERPELHKRITCESRWSGLCGRQGNVPEQTGKNQYDRVTQRRKLMRSAIWSESNRRCWSPSNRSRTLCVISGSRGVRANPLGEVRFRSCLQIRNRGCRESSNPYADGLTAIGIPESMRFRALCDRSGSRSESTC